jgi:hypothetical protein
MHTVALLTYTRAALRRLRAPRARSFRDGVSLPRELRLPLVTTRKLCGRGREQTAVHEGAHGPVPRFRHGKDAMFIGHFGLAFAAHRATPQLSLGTTFLAAQFLDLAWPTLLLLGLESVRIQPGATAVTPLLFEHYPYSHSLLLAMAWGVALGAVYAGVRRNLRGAIVVGLLVLSHWLLDALVHEPDLPLAPGISTLVGLGLWNSRAGTLLAEVPVFLIGVWLYARGTRAVDRIGAFGFPALVLFLAFVYVGNIVGPPPPSVAAIAWVGQAQWLLVAWAYWIDAHREPLPA